MNCKDFWHTFESSGLTPELEMHLAICEDCMNEMKIEMLLNKRIDALPRYKAPAGLWEKISDSLQDAPVHAMKKAFASSKLKEFADNLKNAAKFFISKPAAAGFAVVILLAVLSYIYVSYETQDALTSLASSNKPLTDMELHYAAEIEKHTRLVEESEGEIAPDLYNSYQERLTLLNDYLVESKEALSINEFNSTARKYLLTAYDEIVATLKKMHNKKSS